MGARKAPNLGFTLVEILIVVIILAILACIVIPQFTEASYEARVSALVNNLQTIRSQTQLYKVQHREVFPDNRIVNQMILYTNIDSKPRARPSGVYCLGPYLQAFPENPISGIATVRIIQDAATRFKATNRDRGWWYNTETGEFRADLRNLWVDSDGTRLNEK